MSSISDNDAQIENLINDPKGLCRLYELAQKPLSKESGQLLLRWAIMQLAKPEVADTKVAAIAELALTQGADIKEERSLINAYNILYMLPCPDFLCPLGPVDLNTIPGFSGIMKAAVKKAHEDVKETSSLTDHAHFYQVLANQIWEGLQSLKEANKENMALIEKEVAHPGKAFAAKLRLYHLPDTLKSALEAL